jgi:NAD(P)H-dependent FMN reductase
VVAAVGEGTQPSFLALQHARTVLTDAGANVMQRPDYSLVLTDASFTEDGLVEDPELAESIVDILESATGFAAHQRRADSIEMPLAPAAETAPGPPLANPVPGPLL